MAHSFCFYGFPVQNKFHCLATKLDGIRNISYLFCFIRSNSTKISEELETFSRELRSIDARSSQLSGELVSLKGHQQRSIDTSSTLIQKLQGYEGRGKCDVISCT